MNIVKQWNDNYYTKLARRHNLRSRAAYKLLEIQTKYSMIGKQDNVLDLGAAPGSWSQLVATWTKGKIWAVDLQSIEPINSVEIVKADLYDEDTSNQIQGWSKSYGIDVVLSDMAPNLSGIASVDQARSSDLNRQVFELCGDYLNPRGSLVMKMFQGEGFQELIVNMRKHFSTTAIHSVKATRKQSSEVFFVGLSWQRTTDEAT